jgi:glycosyltransferase involved in cell wall biosynthesis
LNGGFPPHPPPLRVTFLLAGTALNGGTKVVLRFANLLHRRGHRVLVVAEGPRPDWIEVEVGFEQVEHMGAEHLAPCDICIGTFWTTLATAAMAPCRVAVHYCQGYEGGFFHNRHEHPRIHAAYRRPLPALVVAPHLAELLEREYGRQARWVPQPLEPFFRPRWRWRPRRVPRILVPAPFEIDLKGVATALEAVKLLRARGWCCRLVRLSQWPRTAEEDALLPPDEFHQSLRPEEVARLLRRTDLLLSPCWEQEGFGLPVLEALASGVPVVATDIPGHRAFALPAALLVPPRDPERLALAAARVLDDPARWRRMRRAGLAIARGFDETLAVRELEAALYWALAQRGASTATH